MVGKQCRLQKSPHLYKARELFNFRGLSGVLSPRTRTVGGSRFTLPLRILIFSVCLSGTLGKSVSFALLGLMGVLAMGSNLLADDFLCFLYLLRIPTPRNPCPPAICRARTRQQCARNRSSEYPFTLSPTFFAGSPNSRSRMPSTPSSATNTSFAASTKAGSCSGQFWANSLLWRSPRRRRRVGSTKMPFKRRTTLGLKKFLAVHLQARIFARRFSASPSNGISAANIVQRVTPSDQTSISYALYSALRSTSGGVQEGVPQRVFRIRSSAQFLHPKPKSTNLAFQSLSKRTFSGLMSRCETPMRLRQSNAESICWKTRAASFSLMGPFLTILSKSSPLGQYSMKMQIFFSQRMTSQTWAMCSCINRC